ncbi:uncharacterized protein [Drosophila bipectinata]|uniref:uncharacterized protein n=1 Tax=Drosophila bipectinata TaxID=42026 RepID=UPI001C8A8CAE|nr:uncharacterized protein LOC108128735 [Drosophila bipectinata]
MFPNYCFTKSARQSGYDVIRRNYITKDSSQRIGRQPPRREVKSAAGSARNNSEVRYGCEPRDSPVKRSRRQKKVPKWSSSSPKASSSRSVGFRLPAVVCTGARESREAAGDDKTRSEKGGMGPENSSDLNRELQESFADFFSIIHDNVLESVQGAVEKMVSKCFADSMEKMDRISKDLVQQETLLNKIYRDVTNKISDQCETNMNQFKFVTQMLIDNQTVHYRALNQAKLNKQRRKEQKEEEKQRKKVNERKRKDSQMERERRKRGSSVDISRRPAGGAGKECAHRQPQHQLCQQQVPVTYICQSCSEQEAKARPPSRHRTGPVPIRRSASHSMPNLPSRNSVPGKLHSSSTRFPRVPIGRQFNSKMAQALCAPAMTYPPSQRSGSTPRRKLLPRIKSGVGLSEGKLGR